MERWKVLHFKNTNTLSASNRHQFWNFPDLSPPPERLTLRNSDIYFTKSKYDTHEENYLYSTFIK